MEKLYTLKEAKKLLGVNGSREHNRRVSKSNWKAIIAFMSYKSELCSSTRRTPLKGAPDVG